MRRAVIALAGTVAGVVGLVAYRATPEQFHNVQAAPPPETTPFPEVSPSDIPSPAVSATPRPTPTTGAADGTYTGPVEPNFYGDVQVRVVIRGGRIVDVQPVQMPNDRARSAYISQVAGPMLRSEVIQAQSARIDIISGATFTSEGYADSVAAALKQAHFGG